MIRFKFINTQVIASLNTCASGGNKIDNFLYKIFFSCLALIVLDYVFFPYDFVSIYSTIIFIILYFTSILIIFLFLHIKSANFKFYILSIVIAIITAYSLTLPIKYLSFFSSKNNISYEECKVISYHPSNRGGGSLRIEFKNTTALIKKNYSPSEFSFLTKTTNMSDIKVEISYFECIGKTFFIKRVVMSPAVPKSSK